MLRRTHRLVATASLVSALLTSACGEPSQVRPRTAALLVAGQAVDAGTRIVTFLESGGYNAYSTQPRFSVPTGEGKRRYGSRAVPVHLSDVGGPRNGWDLRELRQVIHQLVIHYDVCGTSRQCFKVLHDKRQLSVHLMLDTDGTVYQTLDLQEKAWHAGTTNDGSIGIEIAHIGAYSSPGHPTLRQWYRRDRDGWRVAFPNWMKETGIRTTDFVARPARPMLMTGEIHGHRLYQFDFTDEQYHALARLCAALHRTFPRIRLEVPRDAEGNVALHVLSPDELADWDGLLAHWHIKANKTDPGPAFDWDRVLREARAMAND